jgi:hypothetical protein
MVAIAAMTSGRPAAVADAPARHREALAAAIDGDAARIQPRHHLRQAAEGFVRPVDLLVDVVGADQHARVLQQHFAQRRQFRARVGRAGGIAGAVQQHESGLGIDGGFELPRRDLVAGSRVRIGRDGQAIGQQHHVRVRHPVGRGDDDLVARIDHGHAQVEQRLLGAGGDQDLVALVGEAIVALELGDDRVFEFRHAVGIGVAREAALDGGDSGRTDVGRRVEVGFSHRQADHVLAFALQLRGAGGHGKRGGGLDGGEAVGDEGHGFSGGGRAKGSIVGEILPAVLRRSKAGDPACRGRGLG